MVAPVHLTSVEEAMLALNAEAGWLIVWLALAVQPLISVTVTLYEPAPMLLRFCVVAPFDHKYVSMPVPPDTLKVILPVVAPVHLTSVEEAMLALNAEAGWLIIWLAVVVQPVASFTVMV